MAYQFTSSHCVKSHWAEYFTDEDSGRDIAVVVTKIHGNGKSKRESLCSIQVLENAQVTHEGQYAPRQDPIEIVDGIRVSIASNRGNPNRVNLVVKYKSPWTLLASEYLKK